MDKAINTLFGNMNSSDAVKATAILSATAMVCVIVICCSGYSFHCEPGKLYLQKARV